MAEIEKDGALYQSHIQLNVHNEPFDSITSGEKHTTDNLLHNHVTQNKSATYKCNHINNITGSLDFRCSQCFQYIEAEPYQNNITSTYEEFIEPQNTDYINCQNEYHNIKSCNAIKRIIHLLIYHKQHQRNP
eukprot:2426_1